jgi:polysaccharide pyruvyl transferase WcaK-like protein
MVDKRKIKRFVVWGGWYGSRNIGDRLLLLTITDMLYEAFDECHVTILSANPQFVNEYFHDRSNSQYQIIKPKKDFLKLLFQIATCDLVIFGGAVPFFDQYKQALNMAMIVFIARIFNKPYYLWCTSSYQIRRKINRSIYRKVIAGAKKITCRDKYTVNIFSSLGIKQEPEIVQDPVFTLHNIDYEDAARLMSKYVPASRRSRLFALTPRTLRGRSVEAQTHYNEKTAKEIQHQFEVYSIAFDWLVENGFTPIFIPMNTYPPDDDRIVAKQITENSKWGKQAIIIDEIVMPRTAPGLYSVCEGSLVSRVHGSITSFLGECPPIMYGFETKHKGIMESMELDALIFDIGREPQAIIPMLEFLENNRISIKEKMQINKKLFDEKAHIPCEYINGFLGNM